MTLQEYRRLMQVLSAELAAARSLGRDEGATAMEGVLQRLTEHMGKMYQEGQGLQNQCAQLKSDLHVEMEKAEGWHNKLLQEAQTTAHQTTKQNWTESSSAKEKN
jgi:dsDNA-specific endonuclease/ATPase MutS2